MLVLPAELTHRQASDALRMLLQALKAQREPQVVVDAGALATFDTSALAVLQTFSWIRSCRRFKWSKVLRTELRTAIGSRYERRAM